MRQSKRREESRGGQHHWSDPNTVLVAQDGADPSEAKVFRAHVPPQGACGNHMSAVKVLANLQASGDNLVDTIFTRFIEVDETAKVGELEKNMEAIKVVSPALIKAIFPNAIMHEGADETSSCRAQLRPCLKRGGEWKDRRTNTLATSRRWSSPFLLGTPPCSTQG